MKVAFPSPDFTLSVISPRCVPNGTPSINQVSFFVGAKSFSQTEKHICRVREHFTKTLERPIALKECFAVLAKSSAKPLEHFTESAGCLAKPTFKAALSAGRVTLNWTKGDFDSEVIEGQRVTGTTYAFLDKVLRRLWICART